MPATPRRFDVFAVDITLALAALWTTWCAETGLRFYEEPTLLPGVAAALLLGRAARAATPSARCARASMLACAALGLVLAGYGEQFLIGAWLDTPERLLPLPGLLVVRRCVPTAVALLALASGRGLLPLCLGVAGVAVGSRWGVQIGPAIAILAYTFARDVGRAREEHTLRTPLAQVGLGALATLALMGLLHDLSALTLVPYERAIDRFQVDVAPWPIVVARLLAEAAVATGAFSMARGRTAGLLLVSAIGPVLLVLALIDSIAGARTGWASGCFGTHHPLGARPLYFVGALALAVLPWLGPLCKRLWEVVAYRDNRRPAPSGRARLGRSYTTRTAGSISATG